MKKLIAFLYTIFFFLCLLNYSNITYISKNIISNFINVVIPSLLPLIILNNLFIRSGCFLSLIKRFPLLKEPLIILISILLGAPSLINFLNDLEKQKIITNSGKEIFISSFGGISFAFIYLISVSITSLYKYAFLFFYYLGEIILYLIYKDKNMFYQTISFKTSLNKKIYIDSIKTSILQVLIILVSSLLFNYLFMFNINVYHKLPILCSFIEFSYSSLLAINITNYSNLMLMLILSFTSLSIYFQIYYLSSSYDLYTHIKKRWFIATINTCLFFIFCF